MFHKCYTSVRLHNENQCVLRDCVLYRSRSDFAECSVSGLETVRNVWNKSKPKQ